MEACAQPSTARGVVSGAPVPRSSPSAALVPAPDSDIAALRTALRGRHALSAGAQRAIAAFLDKARRLQQAQGRSGSGSSSSSGFEREYAEICWSIDRAPWFKAALTPQTKETRAKNRYCDVLPFEKTRVKLLGCDYINANHIDDEYIACCAPVPAAIVDFWHMVWECRVHVILMLTNFVERERPKAHVYWDMRGQAVNFDGVRVQLVDETGHEQQQSVDGFITRMFRVWTTDKQGRELESRVVKHLQLTIWPDHGVLRDFHVIAPLLESMNAFRSESSRSSGVDTRVIVHCSAGIGRSGTFIAIDILLKQIQQAIATSATGATDEEAAWTQALDVARVVHRIRSQRPGMVQTPEQYEMIYQYLATILCNPEAW